MKIWKIAFLIIVTIFAVWGGNKLNIYLDGVAATNAAAAADAKRQKEEEILSRLKIEDIVPGYGVAAKNGDILSVMYKGTLEDGKEFDSSYKTGKPYDFMLGQGQVIPGWDKGLVGMKVGGTRRLTIPYELAYGEAGRQGVIPGKATLIFVVELKEIKNLSL